MAVDACPDQSSRNSRWCSEAKVRRRSTLRRLPTGSTGWDGVLTPGVVPQAVTLAHHHPPCARTPCEGSTTFVAQAPRPCRSRGVCRIASVWHLSPWGWETCEYTANPRLGEYPCQPLLLVLPSRCRQP